MLASSSGLETWRCPKCRRILAKMELSPGSVVEIKCGNCNQFSLRECCAPQDTYNSVVHNIMYSPSC